jgi:hypothetical protein
MAPKITSNDSVNTPLATAKDDASKLSPEDVLELARQKLKPLYNNVRGHPELTVGQKILWTLAASEEREKAEVSRREQVAFMSVKFECPLATLMSTEH